MKRHLWFMAGGAGVVLVVLLVAGVNIGQAARYALALACPLGMVAMMFVMGKGSGHRHGSADGKGTAMDHAHAAGGSQVDSVCGMAVDPAHAAATRERDGVRYFFCSTGCATEFDAEPARYLPV